MVFSSLVFLCIFFPVVFCLHTAIPSTNLRNVLLIVASLFFYAFGEPVYVLLMVASAFFNYLCALLMERANRKAVLAVAVAANIGVLGVFKYMGFFAATISSALPIGISFFTFQAMSYVIDVYRGQVAAQRSFGKVLLYISFFPQLIAGPIVKYRDIALEIDSRSVNLKETALGLRRFICGLSKKILVANTMAVAADHAFQQGAGSLDALGAWIGAIAYTMQIYYDFSGYSDMAKGLGKMFNIELPVNFNSPYKACSVKELWQRWHMTLSRFFVQYVYIPLGGSRKGKLRTILNTFLVFFLSGLWHGANWTYVAWGTMQGLLVIWDNLGIVGVKGSDGNTSFKIYIPRWLGWIFTFGFFNLSLYFFRSESMADAFQMFRNIFTFKNTGYIYKVAAKLDIPEFYLMKQIINLTRPNLLQYAFLALFIVLLLVSALILTRKNAVWIAENHPLNSKLSFFVTIIFVWSVISFSQVSTFIYFNF